MMKYLLMFIPMIVFAGDYQVPGDTYNTYVSENTYIEYKDYDEALAAQAALASIPSISHKSNAHNHTGVGFGSGQFNSSTGLGVAFEHQCDSISFKINAAVSGSESIYGAGVMWSF